MTEPLKTTDLLLQLGRRAPGDGLGEATMTKCLDTAVRYGINIYEAECLRKHNWYQGLH